MCGIRLPGRIRQRGGCLVGCRLRRIVSGLRLGERCLRVVHRLDTGLRVRLILFGLLHDRLGGGEVRLRFAQLLFGVLPGDLGLRLRLVSLVRRRLRGGVLVLRVLLGVRGVCERLGSLALLRLSTRRASRR